MTVARGFGLNGKSFYTNVCKPMDVNLNFIVDSTNGNGYGVRSVKSNGYVDSVFMHTTQTAGVISGFTNPNPVAGYAIVTFKNNFNYYLGGFSGQITPLTSTSTTSLTTGHVYVITVVGTTTLANWQAVGLPQGITPAVGVAFVATATTSITGTGTVGLPSSPIADAVSVVGDPNTSLNNSNIASNAGAKILIQFNGYTFTAGAYTPAGTNSAPAFTGSALGTHTHDFTVIGGQAGSTTNDIANYAGPLIGKQEATNATYVGANSATNGGVVAVTAGTPAGTVAAPTFTGSAASLTGTVTRTVLSPSDGTVVGMTFKFDGSSVTIDGL